MFKHNLSNKYIITLNKLFNYILIKNDNPMESLEQKDHSEHTDFAE